MTIDFQAVADATRPDLQRIALHTFATHIRGSSTKQPLRLPLFGSVAIGLAAREGRPELTFKGA